MHEIRVYALENNLENVIIFHSLLNINKLSLISKSVDL